MHFVTKWLYGRCRRNRELRVTTVAGQGLGKGAIGIVLSLDKLREIVKSCQIEEWCKSVEIGSLRGI